MFQITTKNASKAAETAAATPAPVVKMVQCYKHIPSNQNHKIMMSETGQDFNRAPASTKARASTKNSHEVDWITSQSLKRKIHQRYYIKKSKPSHNNQKNRTLSKFSSPKEAKIKR